MTVAPTTVAAGPASTVSATPTLPVTPATPTSPTLKLLYTCLIPVRWGDMDAMGHVNNTNYFRYMEQARVEAVAALGDAPDQAGTGPIIVNTACTFKRPFKYPGTVKVLFYVGAVGRSSIQTVYHLCSVENDDMIFAEGSATVVWINMSTEKAVSVPMSIRSKLTQVSPS